MPVTVGEYEAVLMTKLASIDAELLGENTIWQLSRLLAQQGLCKTLLRELHQPADDTHKETA